MEVLITLEKATISQEVDKITGYTGRNTESKEQRERFDAIATSMDEENLLSSYYYDGVSHLAENLQAYTAIVKPAGSDSLQIALQLPSSFDATGNAFMLNKTACSYVANFMSGKWFNVVKKDETQFYVGECSRIMQGIKRILTTRKKPI